MDVYIYYVRDKVFANGQTGNIVVAILFVVMGIMSKKRGYIKRIIYIRRQIWNYLTEDRKV